MTTDEHRRTRVGTNRKDGLTVLTYAALKNMLESVKAKRQGVTDGKILICTLGSQDGCVDSMRFFARDVQDGYYLSVNVYFTHILFDPLDMMGKDPEDLPDLMPVEVDVVQIEKGADGLFYYPETEGERYHVNLRDVLLFTIVDTPKDDWRDGASAIDLYYTDDTMHTMVVTDIDFVNVDERGRWASLDTLLNEVKDDGREEEH